MIADFVMGLCRSMVRVLVLYMSASKHRSRCRTAFLLQYDSRLKYNSKFRDTFILVVMNVRILGAISLLEQHTSNHLH